MSGTEELMGQRHGADGVKTWSCWGKDVELLGQRCGVVGAKTWSCWGKDVELLGQRRGVVGRNFVIRLICT